jgi:phytoene dehydrogenase-like protein
MEPITYANGSTLDEPAITYGIVFSNFMSKGIFTFEGGTDKLIAMMADELQKNGVTICTGAKAERVLVDKGKVRNVLVNGREIATKAVVSNSGITNTIDQLAGREAFSNDFLSRFNNNGSDSFFSGRTPILFGISEPIRINCMSG